MVQMILLARWMQSQHTMAGPVPRISTTEGTEDTEDRAGRYRIRRVG
jgi:hypothetical protein